MSRPRCVAALGLLLTLLLGLGLVVPAGAAVLPEDAAGSARIELLDVQPPAVTPGSTLQVRATLHNDGSVPLPAGLDLDLMVQRSLLSTRSSVAAWTRLTLQDPAVGSMVARQRLADDVPPGGSVAVDLSVPADDLRLPAAAAQWGPRGLSLLLRTGDGRRLAVTRTHLVWFPGQGFALPTSVTVLVPLTAGAPDPATGTVPLDRLQQLTAPGAALDAALTGAEAAGGVAVALDPALVDPALVDPALTDPAATADASLAGWTARLLAVAVTRETVVLPYGDADLASLAHADAEDLARAARQRGDAAAEQVLGSSQRADLAWPVEGRADSRTLAFVDRLGYAGAVLAEETVQPVDPQRTTVTGRADLRTGGTTVPAVVADTVLSDTLAAVAADSPAAAVQRLLADTAAVTLERPNDARHLLVTAPRGWAPTPDAAARATRALTGVPWVAPGTAAELLGTPADLERGTPTLTRADLADELPPPQVRGLGGQVRVVDDLATALADPVAAAAVAGPARAVAVALVSAGWRGRLDAWRAGVQALAARRVALQGAVRVVPGSPLTQVSREVELPITVENTLPEAVSVVLTVRSTSSRLAITRDVAVQVPPNSSQLAQVPVRGVGSGDASVVAQVRSPGGAAFGEPVTTRVTVRADWETRGTLAVAVLAGLVLVVGLARSIRRGRRPPGHDPLLPAAAPPVLSRS